MPGSLSIVIFVGVGGRFFKLEMQSRQPCAMSARECGGIGIDAIAGKPEQSVEGSFAKNDGLYRT